jgi:hypothetical protein
MLTDAAVMALVKMLLNLRQAANVVHLDLAHNQPLTWRCCTPLGQLLNDSWLLGAENRSSTAGSSSSSSSSSVVGGVCSTHPSSAVEPIHVGTAAARNWGQPVAAAANPMLHIAGSKSFACADTAACVGADASLVLEQAGEARQAGLLPQLQVLCIVHLSLEGLALGDKGARLLSAALLLNQHLKVIM